MFIAQAKTADAPVTIKVTDENGDVHYQTLERPKQLKIANHLPGAEGTSGLLTIEQEDNTDLPVTYYNLSGLCLTPTSPGLYIRRQGTKAEKILIK